MNVFSRKDDETKPPPDPCPRCKQIIECEWFGEYGWLYICDDCEINWEA